MEKLAWASRFPSGVPARHLGLPNWDSRWLYYASICFVHEKIYRHRLFNSRCPSWQSFGVLSCDSSVFSEQVPQSSQGSAIPVLSQARVCAKTDSTLSRLRTLISASEIVPVHQLQKSPSGNKLALLNYIVLSSI